MKATSRRVFGLSLLAYCISFLAFVVYSIITFAPKHVLPSFLWTWVWDNSLVLFIQSLVPVQCTALLLAYSLSRPLRTRNPGPPSYEPFYRLVDSVLVTLLVLALLFAAMNDGALPPAQASLQDMAARTTLAQTYYSDYQKAVRAKQPAAGERYLRLYLDINPSDPYAQKEYASLRLTNLQANLPASEPGAGLSPSEQRRVENENAASLVKLAQSYLGSGNYASAQYYASLVLQLDSGNAPARRIVAESTAAMSRVTPSAVEREQAAFFALKSQGMTELEQGHPIQAYYLFQSLHKSHPNDPDVTTYLSRATEELRQFAFFRSEIDSVAPYPGTRDVLFVDPIPEGGRDIISLGKLVVAGGATYAEDIEVMRLAPTGGVSFELAAPYGKMIGNNLSLYCIGKERDIPYLPRIVTGSYPATGRYQFHITPNITVLQQLGGGKINFAGASLPRLLELAKWAPQIGYNAAPIEIEIMRRVMVPFSFLILSILAIGVGWSLRVKRRSRFTFAYVFVPFLPFVIYRLYSLYLFSGKLLFGFLLTLLAFWPTMVVLAAVQLVLLMLALVYLAGQSVDA